MEKFIYDESNGLWYELQGDYYIPCLTVPDHEQPIGIWGQRHLHYIQEHHKAFYTSLLLDGTLNGYLADISIPSAIISPDDLAAGQTAELAYHKALPEL